MSSESKSLEVVTINNFEELQSSLENLSDDDFISVLHFSTEWTDEMTGSNRRASELSTVLTNHGSVVKLIKVTNARVAHRMGIDVVPTFDFFRGREKVERCTSSDMLVFRESLDMVDKLRAATPFTRGVALGLYPKETGTPLPKFDRGTILPCFDNI